MNITVREEAPEDIGAIHSVNEAAFGRRQEADIVDALRARGAVTLSLVAVDKERVIGHIMFSPVTVASGASGFGALALAPMAVLPGFQRKGIGSRLVRAGLEKCRAMGHEVVVVLGYPDYYPQFGFERAAPLGIECEYEGVPDEAWMVLALQKGALKGRHGIVKFQPEFAAAV
jgi:putative acetyltransferase